MAKFMNDDFLLKTESARKLYFDYAQDMPIYDFHNHLRTDEIAEDIAYDTISDVWLGGDHYKWRIMRNMGADESIISGNGDPKEKFALYCKAISKAIGNPLYHWSHLELRRYFGIDEIICPENVDVIWEKSNDRLKSLTARKLITMSNVDTLCTTDNPVDDLRYHKQLKKDNSFDVAVRPSFRPDNAYNMNKDGFCDYVKTLSEVSGVEIKDIDTMKQALSKRIEFFNSMGCLVSDHALDTMQFAECTQSEADTILKRKLSKEDVNPNDGVKYQSVILRFLASEYKKYGWVMQIHIGALRNNNTPQYKKLGPDTGFDATEDASVARGLSGLMNAIECDGGLPKTILYCLNPKDNYSLLSVGGCFAGDIEGKIQFGPAWWFIDHLEGMKRQLTDLSTTAVLGTFVGMLTDSRSFLSFPRHEYFRRILCDFIGDKVENGEIPWDEKWLGGMVKDISYNNAKRYFEK